MSLWPYYVETLIQTKTLKRRVAWAYLISGYFIERTNKRIFYWAGREIFSIGGKASKAGTSERLVIFYFKCRKFSNSKLSLQRRISYISAGGQKFWANKGQRSLFSLFDPLLSWTWLKLWLWLSSLRKYHEIF